MPTYVSREANITLQRQVCLSQIIYSGNHSIIIQGRTLITISITMIKYGQAPLSQT